MGIAEDQNFAARSSRWTVVSGGGKSKAIADGTVASGEADDEDDEGEDVDDDEAFAMMPPKIAEGRVWWVGGDRARRPIDDGGENARVGTTLGRRTQQGAVIAATVRINRLCAMVWLLTAT